MFTGAAPDFRQWVFSIELAMRALRLSAPADMVTYASSFLGSNAQLWLMSALDTGKEFRYW